MTSATIARPIRPAPGGRAVTPSTPSVAEVLDALRQDGGWIAPRHLETLVDRRSHVTMLRHLATLIAAGLVEENGASTTARRYRAVGPNVDPEPQLIAPSADLAEDQHFLYRIRAAVLRLVAAGPRTESSMLATLRETYALSEDDLAFTCGRLLDGDHIRLAANGTYWPTPKGARDVR